MADLAYANMAEIETGKMALKKSRSEQVKGVKIMPTQQAHLIMAQQGVTAVSAKN